MGNCSYFCMLWYLFAVFSGWNADCTCTLCGEVASFQNFVTYLCFSSLCEVMQIFKAWNRQNNGWPVLQLDGVSSVGWHVPVMWQKTVTRENIRSSFSWLLPQLHRFDRTDFNTGSRSRRNSREMCVSFWSWTRDLSRVELPCKPLH